MGITEKVAYLKGLMEGLEFQAETKEGKITLFRTKDNLARMNRSMQEIVTWGFLIAITNASVIIFLTGNS